MFQPSLQQWLYRHGTRICAGCLVWKVLNFQIRISITTYYKYNKQLQKQIILSKKKTVPLVDSKPLAGMQILH